MKKETIGPGRTVGESSVLTAATQAPSRRAMRRRTFVDAAATIVRQGMAIFDADAGFIAWSTRREGTFELTFLVPGDLEIGAVAGHSLPWPASLPAPLRRLVLRTAKTGRSVFSNALLRKTSAVASGHRPASVHNALVAPIFLLPGEVAGVVGLVNRPGGFSRADRRLATPLAELAALAMGNSLDIGVQEINRDTLEQELRDGATQLRQAETTFRTLVENLPDIVARFDPDLRYLYASPVVQQLTGRPLQSFLGKTNRELALPAELVEPWDLALRKVFTTGLPETLEHPFPTPDGTRYFDWRIVPENGGDGAISSALTVARDVTDRWLSHAAESRARFVAEALREATVALTRSLDRETVLATLLERLGRMVPFDRASVMLIEEARRGVSVRAVFDGDRVLRLLPESRVHFDPAEHPIVDAILKSGAPVVIPDIRALTDWSLPTDRLSEVCWMGVPLFARGNVAGLFSLSKREPGYFNEEHLKLAEALSSQASVAVENAILYEQMSASTERMQTLSRRLVDVQEAERREIARELHDEAGQALVSLRFGLRLMEREIETGESVRGRVAELVERTDAVIENLRRLAADLRPVSLDHVGLDAALRQFAETAITSPGTSMRYKARGFTGQRLPPDVETALFRIAQEAMTNVVRHAAATRVDLLVEHLGDRVRLIIEDNGVGFDPGQLGVGDHIGLIGMRERAEALGGSLTIETASGKGTTIVVEVSSADPSPDH